MAKGHRALARRATVLADRKHGARLNQE